MLHPEGLKTDTWENTQLLISMVGMSASVTTALQ